MAKKQTNEGMAKRILELANISKPDIDAIVAQAQKCSAATEQDEKDILTGELFNLLEDCCGSHPDFSTICDAIMAYARGENLSEKVKNAAQLTAADRVQNNLRYMLEKENLPASALATIIEEEAQEIVPSRDVTTLKQKLRQALEEHENTSNDSGLPMDEIILERRLSRFAAAILKDRAKAIFSDGKYSSNVLHALKENVSTDYSRDYPAFTIEHWHTLIDIYCEYTGEHNVLPSMEEVNKAMMEHEILPINPIQNGVMMRVMRDAMTKSVTPKLETLPYKVALRLVQFDNQQLRLGLQEAKSAIEELGQAKKLALKQLYHAQQDAKAWQIKFEGARDLAEDWAKQIQKQRQAKTGGDQNGGAGGAL